MADLPKLGRYELGRVLGRGAMGVVYEGLDPLLGRRIAVKTILKNAAFDAETERSYSGRFTQEAKAVARLNHPNIVQVYDFGVEGDIAYLVMEFIEGRDLRSFFAAKEKVDTTEAVRIMGELLDALDFAHEAGVIHRDVKPANVMLDAQRRVKLADFGVARIQDGGQRTQADTMVGTPAFMSPEQISGQRIDRRTDIFSAGIVLYQLLTGEQPFKGEGAWTVARAIMQDDPPLPSAVVRDLPPLLDEIVDKALAKKPQDRFANASDFAAALRGALGKDAAAPASVPPRTGRERQTSEAEIEFWRSIHNSADPAEFDVYIGKFPDGTYTDLARIKLAKLRESAKTPGAAAQADDDATLMVERTTAPPAKQTLRYGMPLVVSVVAGVAALAAAGLYLFPGKTIGSAGIGQRSDVQATQRQAPGIAAADPPRIQPIADDHPRNELADGSVRAVEERTAAEKQAAERAAAERLAAESAAAEKAAAERLAAEKAAAEKLAAEKAAADKSAADKAAAEKAAADKAAAEKAAAEKFAADKAAAEKAAADKAAADKAAADKAAADKATAEKAAADRAIAQKKSADKKAMMLAAEETVSFANEDKDWGIEPTSMPRQKDLHTPTPRSIPGARVLKTMALKHLLATNSSVVVVDVLGSNSRSTIPGAFWMPGAGQGRLFPAEKERFAAALAKLTDGNKNRALVFLCLSSECWLSYNASLHALDAGYRNVSWYRGGTDAWVGAGLARKRPERIDW